MDVLRRRHERLDVSGAGLDRVHGHEPAPAGAIEQPVAGLALHAAVDPDHAPRHVIVDGGPLAGEPDQRDHGEPPRRRHVQQVLAVAVAAREPVLRSEPAVLGEEPLEPFRDRMRIVREAVGVAHEGGEGG
jgi:hypothetical protein